MKLTTPYAVLAGFALVALAIASQPFTGSLVPDAWAQSNRPVKVELCDWSGDRCYFPGAPMEVTVCDPIGRICAFAARPEENNVGLAGLVVLAGE